MEGNLPKNPPDSYRSRFDRGIDNIEVRLLNPPHPNEAAETIAVFAETTFGDIGHPYDYRSTVSGDDEAWRLAQGAAEFKHVIPNALETVILTFAVDGVSRATTHQLVRTRVGAGFGQFSQRANNLSGFNMRLPRSFDRMPDGAVRRYYESLDHLQRFYNAAIEAGVPYQDARYVVPEGIETSITATYNLLSLIGTVKRRACNRMQWEINYVARCMADLALEALPWLGRSLRSGCEHRGVCQTTDPMFEPSCVWWNAEKRAPDWCRDNPALIEQMGTAMYNWPRSANDALWFLTGDQARVSLEGENEFKWACAMSDPKGSYPIAKQDENGLWRRA